MIIESIRRLICQYRRKHGPRAPELYWIGRGKNVVGGLTLDQLRQSRQVDTYRAIFQAIEDRSVMEVLDLGCNIAALGVLLYDWRYSGTYVGVDSNPHALAEAARSLKDGHASELVCANIRALPWRDRSLCCVVMKDVLEHMEDFRPLLTEAARVSSKYVIISNFIPWTEGRTIVRHETQGLYHNLYNRREVYSFAQGLGLKVEEVLSALEKDARPNEVVIFAQPGRRGNPPRSLI